MQLPDEAGARGPSETEADYPSAGRAWTVVGILTAGWVFAYLDRQVMSILIEPLKHDLLLTDTQVSLITGLAFSLFFVLAGIPVGRLVDRANRRNILMVGITCWCAATIACGLSTNFWQLFGCRLAVGIGEACLAPASFSIVSDVIRPARRGTAMGILIGGTAVGSACSIFLGGLILQLVGPGLVTLGPLGSFAGWQMVFLTIGAPGMLVALLLLTVKEPERREKQGPGIASAGFLPFLRRHPAAFTFTNLGFAMNQVASYAISVWVPVVLIREFQMKPAAVGLTIGGVLITVGAIGGVCGGALADWLAARMPRLGRLGVPIVCYPAVAVLLVVWWQSHDPFTTVLVFAVSVCLLGSMTNGASYPALNQMVPNELRGQTVAVFLLIANLAGLGLAPTGVALITDFVLRDAALVRQSVILVAIPAVLLGLIFSLLALRPYRAACIDREGRDDVTTANPAIQPTVV